VATRRLTEGLPANPEITGMRNFFNTGQREKVLPLWILLSALAFAAVFFHEPWRDELQAWSISTGSDLTSLLPNIRYESHPVLWYGMLFLVSRIGEDPAYMQVLHALIVSAIYWMILFRSPFSRTVSVLICTGYFFFFEYSVISRGYSAGVLIMLLLCNQYARQGKWYITALLLFLLCQTHIFGIILSVCFFYLFISSESYREKKSAALFLALIFLLALAAGVLQIIPPADSGIFTKWRFEKVRNLLIAFSTVATTYIPLSKPQINFWNQPLISILFFSSLISAALFLTVSYFLFPKKRLLLFYWMGNIGLWAFFYSRLMGEQRHHGHVFMLFIFSLWLFPYIRTKQPAVAEPEEKPDLKAAILQKRKEENRKRHEKLFTLFALMILSLQSLAGVPAYIAYIFLPFSASKEAAVWIRQNNLDKLPVIGDHDYTITPIAAQLNKEIYYPASGTYGSYIVWNRQRKTRTRSNDVIRDLNAMLLKKNSDILLILNYRIPEESFRYIKFQKSFEKSIVKNEKYFIYRADCLMYKALYEKIKGNLPKDVKDLKNVRGLDNLIDKLKDLKYIK
jgi:hypothetical protein